ncbi:MAG: GxxExxY protein [Candidatus Parcubacteria bacterium]|nr:GxxExxY protein [Candidatus Parcubacteria bacterium]
MEHTKIDSKVLYPDLSYKICGLCFNVHNQLGRFRNEKSYADALEGLLKENNISYFREKPFNPSFEEEKERRNIPDFLIEDKIILDLKAKRIITKEDYFQMKRYLISGNKKLGLIVNFRQKYISPKRVLN